MSNSGVVTRFLLVDDFRLGLAIHSNPILPLSPAVRFLLISIL